MKKITCEVESILQTLGSGLFEHIATTFYNTWWERLTTGVKCQARYVDYDRQLDTPSMVQEIKALQAKLDKTEDEDEQRALEEDVTGKILWLCWCGICAEVEELLPKVVDYLRREANMGGLFSMSLAIRHITSADPGDDQTHLQRIMRDARAGTSKHQLLLVARDAEQAKWSGTHGGIAAVENEGTIPSTSSRTPSIPVV
ncbi:hypothetical protein EDC04DRAFT_1761162 [Pisolithus marmoratus]|nr:hypothetical protein EDC04DRAFT_1761162 [Pisolithus marmoratus]